MELITAQEAYAGSLENLRIQCEEEYKNSLPAINKAITDAKSIGKFYCELKNVNYYTVIQLGKAGYQLETINYINDVDNVNARYATYVSWIDSK
jgi:hypothetical protein